MLCFKAQKTYQVTIVFLDHRELKCYFKGDQKCEQLMRTASNFLNLHDKCDYFGLHFIDGEKRKKWIDLTKSVDNQLKTEYKPRSTDVPDSLDQHEANNLEEDQTEPIRVFFCVKYYIPDPCKLRSAHVRYLFYLQLRSDVAKGRLPTQEYAVDLFGYFLQDELGDYDSKVHSPGYASEFEFSPYQPAELEAAAEVKHKRLKGMSQELVEMNFLNKAKWLEMYGVELHPVRGEDNMEYNLGLTPTGICVYKSLMKVNGYFWPRITKLNCKQSKLLLTVIDKSNEETTQVFELETADACKQLWKTCLEHHRFFSAKAVYEQPLKLSTSLATSKNRNSIRSLNQYAAEPQQTELLNSASAPSRASKDGIVRIAAKRQPSKRRITNILQTPDSNSGKDDGMRESKQSPTQSYKSRKRRESTDSRVRSHRRTRSNTSRTSRNLASEVGRKCSDADNHQEQPFRAEGTNQVELKTPSNRTRHRRRRTNSRSSYKETFATDNKSSNEATGEIRENGLSKSGKYHDPSETCHETSLDEMNETNVSEKKRQQIRRRRRSKSPGVVSKPPEEILSHIKYSLVETNGLSETELKEIAFVKIETTAPPFRISPHQRHRRISPHRRKSREFHETKSSVTAMSNGVAQIIKTETCIAREAVKIMPAKANIASLTVTDKTRLVENKYSSNGFSADSGCEGLASKRASNTESNEETISAGYPIAYCKKIASFN